jgi:hypothetical protein
MNCDLYATMSLGTAIVSLCSVYKTLQLFYAAWHGWHTLYASLSSSQFVKIDVMHGLAPILTNWLQQPAVLNRTQLAYIGTSTS